jgi:hypothetical protein
MTNPYEGWSEATCRVTITIDYREEYGPDKPFDEAQFIRNALDERTVRQITQFDLDRSGLESSITAEVVAVADADEDGDYTIVRATDEALA